jgi:cytochrome b
MAAGGDAALRVKVWDRPVRLLHWALALSCVAAWVTSEVLLSWHEPIGYAALATVAARIAWGFTGGRYARFSQFVRAPRITWQYAVAVMRGTPPRYVGHNPLGGWMALALWTCVTALGVSGWLYTTDLFWGSGWLNLIHLALAWLLLALVAVHLAGVLHTSRKHGECLVLGMLGGEKRPAGPDDID